MTVSLKHTKTSAIPDDGDANLVQPSDWNAEHSLTIATGTLVGRTTAGTGTIEEITVGTGLLLSGGTLTSTDVGGTVTSVAALTLGSTGTDLTSTVANPTTTPTITLNVPTASASNRGALSSADWTTFNNKGSGTVTNVSGTAPVVSSGGATPAISMAAATGSVDGYLTSTDWTTFNNKGSGTVTSVSGTAPVVSSGGATPAISMAAATGSVNGYLTSTDWTTFNGKAVYPGAGIANSTGTAWGTSYTTTGTGTVVALATSPTLTTPVLGTPTSGNLTNCTADGTNAVGYLTIPQNAQTGSYTLVLADSGKSIFHAAAAGAATYTIPANGSVAYPLGTTVTFINMSANAVTIDITTDTLYFAGTGATGSRTLALYGVVTATKMTSTTWIISGSGLT